MAPALSARLFLLGLAMLLTVVSNGLADRSVVQDGDFTNWQSTVVTEGSGGAWITRVPTGGNPGAYLEIGTYSGWEQYTWALAWKDDYVWDPSVSGGILTVSMRIDEKAVDSFGGGQNMKLLVVQGAPGSYRYYGGPLDPWGTGSGVEEYWITYPFDPMDAMNLGEVRADAFDPSQHPDFSSSGAPIRFGFVVGVSSVLDARVHAYDNWEITIEEEQPSPVLSTTWGRVRSLYR